MEKRVELPLHLLDDSVAINHLYTYDSLEYLNYTELAIVQEGNVLALTIHPSDMTYPEITWERKENKLIAGWDHRDKGFHLYDVSKEVKLVRYVNFGAGPYIRSIDNNHLLVSGYMHGKYTPYIYNIKEDLFTLVTIHKRNAYPFFYGNLLSIDVVSKEHQILSVYNIKQELLYNFKLQDGELRLGKRNDNMYYIVCSKHGNANIFEVDNGKLTQKAETKWKRNTNNLVNIDANFTPNGILIFNTEHVSKYYYDYYTEQVKEITIEATTYSYYIPASYSRYQLYREIMVDDTDKITVVNTRIFHDLGFNTPEERLELKCTINVFLNEYIPSDICNMVFQCINTY